MIKNSTRIIYILLMLSVIISGCGTKTLVANNDKVEKLPDVEITEYNGMQLSTLDHVKDVSIKGPQKLILRHIN